MEILFLGTGEAFGAKANTSILIDGRILLDCGLTTVQQLQKAKIDANKISVISISHFHMDHVFGVPAFLCLCRKQNRKTPVTIIGPQDSLRYVTSLLSVAHKTFDSFQFEIKVLDASKVSIDGYNFDYADMQHTLQTKAIAIEVCGKKVAYTGDGKPTGGAIELFDSADLLIAESFIENHECHSSIADVVEYANNANVRNVALVHISANEDLTRQVKKAKRAYPNLIVPEDLDKVTV